MAQKIISGNNAYLRIADIIKKCGAKKVFIVCDGAFQFIAISEYITELLPDAVKFSDFTPNPLYEDVCRGVELFKREKCDIIMAIGGGSTIDVAKCIKLYSGMNPDENYLTQKGGECGVPFIAVPTTAGTGSESTRFAVIYYRGEKQSVNDTRIIPDYAVLEKSVLYTLPVYQKKCTVLDALCQAIESWWSVNSDDESKSYSQKAISLIMHGMEPYLAGADEEAAEKILLASNYAGRAINITQTTAPHAMSYKLTSFYNIPHGHAVAICLPGLWRHMIKNISNCIDGRGADYLRKTFDDIAKALGTENAEEAVCFFDALLQKLDISAPYIRNEDLPVLGKSVNPVRLKNNPVALSEAELTGLYADLSGA